MICVIVIYGAGEHTKALLEAWPEIIGTKIYNIILTQKDQDFIQSIPVLPVDRIQEIEETTLTILSTLVFEKEMISEIEARSSKAKYLSLYDDSLNHL